MNSPYGSSRSSSGSQTIETTATVERTLIDAAVDHLQAPQVLHEISGPTTHLEDKLLLITLPDGHKLQQFDNERLLPRPRRIRAKHALYDANTFNAYVAAHRADVENDEGTATTIWADMDPAVETFVITAYLDDNAAEPSWCTHTATYSPSRAVEWDRWLKANGRKMGQLEFATFIEDNIGDIASVEGRPNGADLLKMALDFEAKADMRFKSTVRLQRPDASAIEYISDDDKGTVERMEVFNRFSLGLPVFWGGARCQLDARLRYAYPSGKLQFWVELVRPDRVYEMAAKKVLDTIREALPTVPLYIGQHISTQHAEG